MPINLEFITNKVDTETQISCPFYYEGVSKETAKKKVMFIGNSITIHEPLPSIGWTKKCGMAASDEEHDYVHLVFDHLLTLQKETSLCVFNLGQWEKDFTNALKLLPFKEVIEDFKPDLVVVRLGENFNHEYIKKGIDPALGFNDLINLVKTQTNNIIMTSLFWEYDVIDEAIENVAKENNFKYVLLNDLGNQRQYLAYNQYNNDAIYCGHPGDEGMKEIAQRIIKVL